LANSLWPMADSQWYYLLSASLGLFSAWLTKLPQPVFGFSELNLHAILYTEKQ